MEVTDLVGLNPKACLVSQLSYVEGYNDRLNQVRINFNQTIQSYRKLPGYQSLEVSLESLPEINIPEIQKWLVIRRLEGEKFNYVLFDALKNGKPVEQTLRELSKVNEGYKRFFPKVRNKEHNERVEEIGELVGEYVNVLETGRILNTTVPMTIFFTGGGFVIDALNPIQLPIPIFGISGCLASIAASIKADRQESNKSLPWESAKYLDKKLEELF